MRVIAFLNSQDVKALPIGNKKWYEIDDIQDKDIAETIFANNDDEQLAKMNKRYGGYWRFPQLLDYCYLVNPYFPPKRMLEEMRANFDTLLTEYPSGMGCKLLACRKIFWYQTRIYSSRKWCCRTYKKVFWKKIQAK